jgi:hypothetical protein
MSICKLLWMLSIATKTTICKLLWMLSIATKTTMIAAKKMTVMVEMGLAHRPLM